MDKRYLIVDIEGTELTQEDKEILKHPAIYGVILFSRNFKNIEQIKKLNKEIKSLKNPELLIAIDHEGGIVQRIKEPLTILPAAKYFGDQYDIDQEKALNECFSTGATMARELKSIGIDFSFAPVIDRYNSSSSVLSTRAYHYDPEIISQLAKQFSLGAKSEGMFTVGKHFPGHGSVNEDSHLQTPTSNLTLKELEEKHLKPFIKLKNNISSFMTGHIIFPNIDLEMVTFSKYWLTHLLRDKYKYRGLIFSDCLNMQAAVQQYPNVKERVTRALNAGVDVALLCNDRNSVIKVIS